jgi:PTS system mannose-specific IIB component/fructoselysine and glucoselysine-specific PTS system IIB component
VPVELVRIDDRMIHGQVVVGWGQPLDVRFIVLVDDAVATSDWEQELYRMGVPPSMDLHFDTVADFAARYAAYAADPRSGVVLAPDIPTLERVVEAVPAIRAVNLGGIHHRADRTQRLRYLFLSDAEAAALRALAARGVVMTAQDVPSARPIPLDDLLAGRGER